ncbi:MAG: hypothetical protein PHH26_02535 [Candidatus Thermoplasmatota archaeon]|nr:hypothetical protein [Candidatus Thermoplasmatota archaeon]
MTRNFAICLAVLALIASSFSGCVIPISENSDVSGSDSTGDSQSADVHYQFGKNVAGENGRIPDSFTAKNGNPLYLQIGANCGGGYTWT